MKTRTQLSQELTDLTEAARDYIEAVGAAETAHRTTTRPGVYIAEEHLYDCRSELEHLIKYALQPVP